MLPLAKALLSATAQLLHIYFGKTRLLDSSSCYKMRLKTDTYRKRRMAYLSFSSCSTKLTKDSPSQVYKNICMFPSKSMCK